MRLAVALFGTAVATSGPNPIRRVVTLLQEMQEEIEAEVEKEKKLYAKFECFCKNNSGSLDAKQQESAALIAKTRAEVESNTARKKALKEEIKKHKKERSEAEKTLAQATQQRTEEKQKYDEATREQQKTLQDIDKAIAALEKGMGKSFLQTGAAAYLRQVVESNSAALSAMDVEDQQMVASFLESGKDYAPAGGEIVGILKMMKDNFDESLGGIVSAEEKAVAAFNKMKASLTQLIKASGKAIETKTEEKGKVAVAIVEGKNVINTTEKEMGADAAAAAQLKEQCAGKGDEFAQRQKDASAEVEAIGMAIGVLNNDDALDLFKKTDTRAAEGASLLQVSSPKAAVVQALSQKFANPTVAMIAYQAKQAAGAKKVDFSKILGMIDDMVKVLKEEGDSDLKERDYCSEALNDAEAEEKETKHTIAGKNARIEELNEQISAAKTVIGEKTLEISEGKKAMQQASDQRREENADFLVAVDLNKQAVELIMKAKDKLNAYYNPQLVRQEETVDPTREEHLENHVRSTLVQAPDMMEEPETWSGERKNKGSKGASVLALMDMLANDLNKDTADMEHTEKTAQKDYEKLSKDLADQIAAAMSAKTEGEQQKATAEGDLQTTESELSMHEEELADVQQTQRDLHARCDFLLQNFEERKMARENEISGLTNAKAILAGAKFD